ncbi:MAG: aminotransferase class IV [Planctomycetota bacterium]
MSARPTSLIETIGVFRSELRLFDRHVQRLCSAMLACGDREPLPRDLREQAEAMVRADRHDVVRIERVLATSSAPASIAITTRSRRESPWARSLDREPVRLLPVVAQRGTSSPPVEQKALPRTYWDRVLQEARAGGADDGIALAPDGALLETAVGNLWLLLDSVWTTPPCDAPVLPGIARALLLERAAAVGIPTAERRCELSDLHRAEALVVSNAAFGPVQAVLGPSTAGECNTSLQRLWRFAVGD